VDTTGTICRHHRRTEATLQLGVDTRRAAHPPSYGAPPAYGGAPAPRGGYAPAPAYPGGGAPAGSGAPAAAAPAYPGAAGAGGLAPAYGGGLDTSAEMRLFSGATERQKYDGLSDLFVCILQTEHLERMFARGNVGREEYEKECNLLITRFKMTARSLQEAGHITTAVAFMTEYGLDTRCTQAKNRLLKVGMPATMLSMQTDGRDSAVHVRDCTQDFITAMDQLRLNVVDVDEVQPTIASVVRSMNKLAGLPPDHAAKARMYRWQETLNTMRATDRLDEDQARQLAMDLESSYAEFNHWLETSSGK